MDVLVISGNKDKFLLQILFYKLSYHESDYMNDLYNCLIYAHMLML